jgi:hypothetical protein
MVKVFGPFKNMCRMRIEMRSAQYPYNFKLDFVMRFKCFITIKAMPFCQKNLVQLAEHCIIYVGCLS